MVTSMPKKSHHLINSSTNTTTLYEGNLTQFTPYNYLILNSQEIVYDFITDKIFPGNTTTITSYIYNMINIKQLSKR